MFKTLLKGDSNTLNIAQILRTASFIEYLRWLLLSREHMLVLLTSYGRHMLSESLASLLQLHYFFLQTISCHILP